MGFVLIVDIVAFFSFSGAEKKNLDFFKKDLKIFIFRITIDANCLGVLTRGRNCVSIKEAYVPLNEKLLKTKRWYRL